LLLSWLPLMRHRLTLPLMLPAAMLLSTPAGAAQGGVLGYWQEPSGAVIQVAACGPKLCLQLVALSSANRPRTDVNNPDEKLRTRNLCGLRIGEGFTLTDPQHAEGGHLYDPKSGHTYSGSMSAEGNSLKLRGYLGIKLLGRTETWARVGQDHATCT
jgi:uncharacterized protein (DUF2147 family)